jgi:hypothetical protein
MGILNFCNFLIGCLISIQPVLNDTREVSFFCKPDNDIYKLIEKEDFIVKRYTSISDLIHRSKVNSGVFILADGYPEHKNKIDEDLLLVANKKNLQLYIEYPESIKGIKISDSITHTKLERGIVISKVFGDKLPPLSLLGINDCHLISTVVNNPLIVMGKVAGFEKAEFGVGDVTTSPILFKLDNLLVATTKLSNFATARYGPSEHWKIIWEYIISEITQDNNFHFKNWLSYVSPSYSKEITLTKEAYTKSIEKGVLWYYKSRLLVDSSWINLLEERTAKNGKNVVYPLVNDDKQIGNGHFGILEGNASQIKLDGSQPGRWWVRADCQSETAFALSMSYEYLKRDEFKKTACNLLDYLFVRSNLRAGPRNDPSSPTYGLIGWATTDADAYYGDDNARVILSAIGASAAMDTSTWSKYIIEAILANFRTSGKEGFRGNWFRDSMIQRTGWQNLYQRDIINVHPHYESWLWACYLWLYNKTGWYPLLKRAKEAICIAMENYPNWKWTNGIQQERGRMILPLAWLVRVEDTPLHRKWLSLITGDLLGSLQQSGAIREELGDNKRGKYGSITSNADYGVREAPLISKNGDPVADLLYTMNFAFFGLNEAAHATNDSIYFKAVDQIASFLVRIQVASKSHPELDGAWFRAFNYDNWDYWASNADQDWGAWCTETGWIQGWIVSTLILQQKHSSFWHQTKSIKIKQTAVPLIEKMLGIKYKLK